MFARLFTQAVCGSMAALVLAIPARGQLPPALIYFEKPTFPRELKGTLHDGHSTIAFTVAADGRIDDAVVLEASHEAFGESVLRALSSWRFETVDETALPRREVLRIDFRLTDAIATVTHRDAAKAAFPLTRERRLPIRTVAWAALSAPPAREIDQAPMGASQKESGRVAISYVIDTTGRVRVPAVVDTTHRDLAIAALEAVKHWKFAPPVLDGSPVLVDDVRSFTFNRK